MILVRKAIIVIVMSMILSSNGHSMEKDCIIRPEGLWYNWNTEEPLKFGIFIPPHWWRGRSENSYLYFSTVSNVSFILNSTQINERSEDLEMSNFISFQQAHRPMAGWTSVFLFLRANSILMEDQEHNPMVQHSAAGNHSLLHIPSNEILRLKIKGMSVVVNCDSTKRTFYETPHSSAHDDYKIKIPVTLYNGKTRVSFYSNDSMQIHLVHDDESTSLICKEIMDLKSDALQLIRNLNDTQYCDLLPKMRYYFNVSSSMLNQSNIAKNRDLTIGFLQLYSRNKISISTDAFINLSMRTSQLTEQQTGASLYFLPPLIAVSTILTILILAGIGAIVWRTIRQKMQRRQEQMYSSGSWAQQNFDSVKSSEIYIENTAYDKTGSLSGKKFSVSSEYSGPADQEYDEPIYSDGRESDYESIYETAYFPPQPPELPKAFVKKI